MPIFDTAGYCREPELATDVALRKPKHSLLKSRTCSALSSFEHHQSSDDEEKGQIGGSYSSKTASSQCSTATPDDLDSDAEMTLPGFLADQPHEDLPFMRSRTCPDVADVGIRPESASSSRKGSLCTSQTWYEPNETLILLDWDDTLCPSTSCENVITSCNPTRTPALVAHEEGVVELLRSAAQLAGVVIVTMAKLAWVEHTIQQLMPAVGDVIKELDIEVISARASKSRLIREAMGESREPSQFLKRNTMSRVIKKFYAKGGVLRRAMGIAGQRSWKNILSIGDSDAERFALQDIVFHHVQRDKAGRWKDCRCKTVLLKKECSLADLTEIHERTKELLPALIHFDGDLDVDVNIDQTNGFVITQSNGLAFHGAVRA